MLRHARSSAAHGRAVRTLWQSRFTTASHGRREHKASREHDRTFSKKKGRLRGPLSSCKNAGYQRQADGRYFDGMLVPALQVNCVLPLFVMGDSSSWDEVVIALLALGPPYA